MVKYNHVIRKCFHFSLNISWCQVLGGLSLALQIYSNPALIWAPPRKHCAPSRKHCYHFYESIFIWPKTLILRFLALSRLFYSSTYNKRLKVHPTRQRRQYQNTKTISLTWISQLPLYLFMVHFVLLLPRLTNTIW